MLILASLCLFMRFSTQSRKSLCIENLQKHCLTIFHRARHLYQGTSANRIDREDRFVRVETLALAHKNNHVIFE